MSAAVLIVIGVIECFFGARFLRTCVLVAGFGLGWFLAEVFDAGLVTTFVVALVCGGAALVVTLLFARFVMFVVGMLVGGIVGAKLFLLVEDDNPTWALAIPPALGVLGCLILTKSRSAYLGLGTAALVLAWRERRRVPARTIALAGLGLVGLLAGLVAIGVATRQLDPQVISESTKSLRYRWEYWQGTWGVIRREPGVWWRGLGPGNFRAPYLRHRLPQSSEAVTDPMVWYRGEGSEERMRRNMKRMLESVRAFLDIDRIESHPMSEYRIQE